MGVFGTSLSGSNSNDGKNQDAIPLSALNTEQIDVEHKDSFLLQNILVSESSFDGIRTSKALYVDKTRCDHITHLLTLTHSYSLLLTLTHSYSLINSQ